MILAVSRSQKGRFAIVTDRGAGDAVAAWGSQRVSRADERALADVKSYGPGVPVLTPRSLAFDEGRG